MKNTQLLLLTLIVSGASLNAMNHPVEDSFGHVTGNIHPAGIPATLTHPEGSIPAGPVKKVNEEFRNLPTVAKTQEAIITKDKTLTLHSETPVRNTTYFPAQEKRTTYEQTFVEHQVGAPVTEQVQGPTTTTAIDNKTGKVLDPNVFGLNNTTRVGQATTAVKAAAAGTVIRFNSFSRKLVRFFGLGKVWDKILTLDSYNTALFDFNEDSIFARLNRVNKGLAAESLTAAAVVYGLYKVAQNIYEQQNDETDLFNNN